MKSCICCSSNKPLAEFYKHPACTDGHSGRCKECQKAVTLAARSARPEYYKKYDRDRSCLPHRIEAREAYQKTEAYRESTRKGSILFIFRNPEKRKAHILVGNAIKNGHLIRKPCEKCGNSKSQAHHDDYQKPLDVRWLCSKCHAEHHKNLRNGNSEIFDFVRELELQRANEP